MASLADTLREKIRSRRARTGVVGLGYVGLPLAVELAKAGFHATGIDLDARKVAIDQRRSCPTSPTSPPPMSRRCTRRGCSTPRRTSPSARELDTINICVPTPLRKTKDPDMSYIVSAVEGDRASTSIRAC